MINELNGSFQGRGPPEPPNSEEKHKLTKVFHSDSLKPQVLLVVSKFSALTRGYVRYRAAAEGPRGSVWTFGPEDPNHQLPTN
jgi:hypothetical protein